MIYGVIWLLAVLIEKLAIFNKQFWGFIASLNILQRFVSS